MDDSGLIETTWVDDPSVFGFWVDDPAWVGVLVYAKGGVCHWKCGR